MTRPAAVVLLVGIPVGVGGIAVGLTDGGLRPVLASLLLGVVLAAAWLVHRRGGKPAAAPGGGPAPAQDHLAVAVANVGEAVLAVDGDGRVLECNPAFGALAGVDPAHAVGRSVESVVPFARLQALVLEVRRTGQPQREEIAVGTPDEERALCLDVQVRPLRLGDGAGGVLVLAADLSRVRRLESMRRDFVANVSHELKTPLAAIQGFCETMLDDAAMAADTRQRFLSRIHGQCQRLGLLVRDLLTLSRLDEERDLAVTTDTSDWAGVLRENWRDLRPLGERRGQQLELHLPPAAVWIRSDREALLQIGGNLLENAIKYTGEGGRVILRLEAGADSALLEVTDNGIGLSEADRERVFERFYRVDRARSREVGGTGLGLSIVKNTVLNLGGTLGVRSRLGTGSTFWVRLPTVPAPAAGDPDA